MFVDKSIGLFHSDSMNQVFLGSLETVAIIYSINKLDLHLRDTYNIVNGIMETYTHIALIQVQE